MIPKTKLHHQVLKLFDKRPKLSETKRAWAKKILFKRYYFETKHNLTCMECGHRWDKPESRKKYHKCPECNTPLIKWNYPERTDRSDDTFMVIENIKGFQVARYYTVTKYMKVLHKAVYIVSEVVNQWLSPEGKMTSIARLIGGFSGYWNGSLDLRKADNYYLKCICYPKKWIHPHVYRNGYDGNDHGFHIMYQSKILLAYPIAETLLKTRKWDLYDNFSIYESQFKKYWKSMIVAWRHNFDIESDIRFWFDHMDLLTFFKMDRHNPKFICSPNMKQEHIELSDKRTKTWEKKRREEVRLAKEEYLRREELRNKSFENNFGKYFHLKWNLDRDTEIVVLKDINDFIEEGKALHHCVGSYFGREDSLIFSTRHKGKRIETAQFDLLTMEVTQARGACNQNSPYHNQVIDTLNMKANLIKKIS